MNIIHPQLQKDCLLIGRFPLSLLLMVNDAHYPWFILLPQRKDICEIYQLTTADQNQLLVESSELSRHLMQQFKGDKLNVAAIGNMVPQLHLHHVVRYRDDASWPAPVWGRVEAKPYDAQQRGSRLEQLDAVKLSGLEVY